MADDKIPASEKHRFVRRGDNLAQGSRSGQDRRDDNRGLAPGRRYDEQTRVRRQFIDRVKEMRLEGCPNVVIAQLLNEEGLLTARNERWTEHAIEQLLNTERAREGRDAWRPKALESADEESS